MTFSGWDEAECNGEIQRDETTGVPFRYVNPGMSDRRYRCPDREAGAERRLARIMSEYPNLRAYRQGDPRGASLYIGGLDMTDSNYNYTGVAVY